jgi:hypothetical protein
MVLVVNHGWIQAILIGVAILLIVVASGKNQRRDQRRGPSKVTAETKQSREKVG